MQNEVPLLQKVYDFYKIYYEMLDHFPRKSREVLTVKIEGAILNLIQHVSKASFSNQVEKIKCLNNASGEVDFLKILFRLCYELKIIDPKKYFLMNEKIMEMGRMTGGWIKDASHSQ